MKRILSFITLVAVRLSELVTTRPYLPSARYENMSGLKSVGTTLKFKVFPGGEKAFAPRVIRFFE